MSEHQAVTRDQALLEIAKAASVYVDEHYRLGVSTPLPELFMKLATALKTYDAAVHHSSANHSSDAEP